MGRDLNGQRLRLGAALLASQAGRLALSEQRVRSSSGWSLWNLTGKLIKTPLSPARRAQADSEYGSSYRERDRHR
jgi:hypothetical protein